MRKKATTLFGVMVETGGIRAASRALTYLAAWAIVSHKLGHPAISEEFMEYWRCSQATVSRDRKALLKSMPAGWDVNRMQAFVWAARRAYVVQGAELSKERVARVVAEMRFAEAA